MFARIPTFLTILATSCLFLSCKQKIAEVQHKSASYLELTEDLLLEWTDAMINQQIHSPEDSTTHGALICPASEKIHGRCMDAVYPFMYMADKTGDQKYLDAAISVMQWSENVSLPDGSWTVMQDPKSWRGIAVFGAIALADALRYHGHILPEPVRKEWTARLEKAADYVYQNFTMTYSHINYGITGVYALQVLGEVLENEKYTERARTLAKEIPDWLTKENKLIFGEDKPSTKRSKKGLLPVDLGYNVEETLNGAVLYALAENDEKLLNLLQQSMESHLEFMLPDGAWDNSWGTRQNKWSYWGSRTTDGCQPAFAMMAGKNAAFGTAAYRNTELLKKCTVDGLLSGGLHYEQHGIKPCMHHTFAHAKSLAYILDHSNSLPKITKEVPLPRSIANGIKHFEEIDVWLGARGPWKFTVSSYDNVFKTAGSNQATGGSLSMLYHEKTGPLMAASMAKYMLAEKNNQQPQPGEEFATTPRLEIFDHDSWFTNLYDLEAIVEAKQQGQNLLFNINARLVDENRKAIDVSKPYQIRYQTDGSSFIISVKNAPTDCTLVLPIISPSNESYTSTTDSHIEIYKHKATVEIKSDKKMVVTDIGSNRIFNMVPGIEVIPILIPLKNGESTTVNIEVK